jgi:hypothetical protein
MCKVPIKKLYNTNGAVLRTINFQIPYNIDADEELENADEPSDHLDEKGNSETKEELCGYEKDDFVVGDDEIQYASDEDALSVLEHNLSPADSPTSANRNSPPDE